MVVLKCAKSAKSFFLTFLYRQKINPHFWGLTLQLKQIHLLKERTHYFRYKCNYFGAYFGIFI